MHFLLYQVDPYVGISDDLQVHVKAQADVRGYGSVADNQLASSLLSELQSKIFESDKVLMDIILQTLSTTTEVPHLIILQTTPPIPPCNISICAS
jgi:hypothetical protein